MPACSRHRVGRLRRRPAASVCIQSDDWSGAYVQVDGPAEVIDYVLAWHHQPGTLRDYPRLKAIFSLGAGVEKLLRDKDLPAGVPNVRMVDQALTTCMTEYVVLHVLRYHRRMPELEALQRRAEWVELEAGGDKFSSLIKTMGAPSIVELEKIIGELQQARTYLQAESERIERETVGYAELSQTAMESVRIIAETVGEWRKAGHPVRSTSGT